MEFELVSLLALEFLLFNRLRISVGVGTKSKKDMLLFKDKEKRTKRNKSTWTALSVVEFQHLLVEDFSIFFLVCILLKLSYFNYGWMTFC